MKRRIVIIGIVVVALAGGFVLVKHWRARRAPKEPTVSTAQVTRGDLRVTVSATGVLEPLTTVEVRSRSGGEITKILVDEGDYVRAGQVIAQIDPTELKGRVEQARATAEGASARLSRSRIDATASRQQTSASIAESQASLAASYARAEQAEAELQQSRVSAEQAVAQAQASLEAARARLRQAQAQERAQPEISRTAVANAEAAKRSAQERLAQLLAGSRPQELAQARARVQSADAAAENAALTLERQEALLARGFVSRQVVDDARRTYRAALADQETARQALSLAEAGPREEEIEQARAAVDQAQASLESARAQTVQVGIRTAEREAAEQAVKEAIASLETSRANRAQIAVRQQALVAARESARQAEASLRRAETARVSDAGRDQDIRSAAADLRKAQVALDDELYSFRNTTILAPRDGVVLEKFVEEGTVIPPGTAAVAQGTTIVTIADITEMYVLADVDEADVAPVKVGMPVEIAVDALPTKTIRGEVVKVFPQSKTEQNVVHFPVRIKVLDLLPDLRPGMTADATIVVSEKKQVLLIPDAAIDRSGGGTKVQVANADDPTAPPEERQIEVGASDWEQTEVVRGLRENETVLLPQSPASATFGAMGPGGQQTRADQGKRAMMMTGRAMGMGKMR